MNNILKNMCLVLFLLMPTIHYTDVTLESIKGRQVAPFELTDIIFNLSLDNKIDSVDRWRALCPMSFKDLNFTMSYVQAGDRLLGLNKTNQAIRSYIKAFQQIDKEVDLKIEAAFRSSMLLYAQQKRTEALFYINRAVELLAKHNKVTHKLAKDIFYLKRRIVWRYFSRIDSLPDNAISSIEFDGDDVWIGMWSGGVGRFSRSESVLDLFNVNNTALPSNYVRDILVMEDRVWIATHCGLAYYHKNTSTWHSIASMKKYKFKTIIYNNGYYYLSTIFNGVFRSQDGEVWENIVPHQNVLDILFVNNGLYIATSDKGVYLYKNEELTQFLPGVSAKTIIVDKDPKYLWIGTYGQGLLKVEHESAEIVQSFGKKQLDSDYIESLLFVDNELWVGTLEAGLSMYTPEKNKWFRLGLSEGLPGLDITTLTRENDYVWLGTLAGGIGIYQFQ